MKKVAFSTISTTVGDDNLNFTSTNAHKNDLLNKKKAKQKNDEEHALRFEINLNLSDESNDNCAEFSFKELVKDAESKSNLPDDPDSIYERQEEEKLKEIAKNFEAKYGTSTKKKKFKNTYEDYIDKGLGYDETDSFIDNGEAYDELLPSTITTKYGGFYINFGKLEFRACSDEEENLIADDDLEEDEDSREFRSSKKRKNRSTDFEKVKRKKRVIESDDDNQNDNSRDLESDEDDEEDSESISSSSNSQQNNQLIKKKKLQQNNKQHPNQAIKNIIDSVVKKSTNNKNGSQSTPNSSIKLNSQTNNNNKDDQFSIPDELNSNVKEKLQQLKDMKLNQPDNKKPRNYSDDIYKIIFDIDCLVQNSSSSTRNQVQSWLTNYLAISKDTLTKRIKKMRISNEEAKLKQNVSQLRMEVSYLIEEYEEAYEEKLSKWEKDKQNGLDSKSPEGGLDKEFKFNDKIRELLRKILNSKRLLVDLAGIKGKQEEDNITNYFNNEIKNIWPSNWITNSNLLKNAGFISKYNNQTSVDKSSISVIKKTPPRPTNHNNNQQPLNLNISKSSSQQQQNSNINKEKVKQQNHPKDLSIEKLNNKNDKYVNSNNNSLQQQQQQQQQQQIKSPAESLLAKKQNEQIHQKSSLLNNNPQQLNSLDNFHQQYSLNSLTKNASNLMKSANIEQMQHKIGQQLKEHNNSINKNLKQQQAHQQLLQQQQNKFQQQQVKSSQPLDKPQNLSNYASFNMNNSHNSSTQNLSKKQSSSSQLNDLQQRQQSSTTNHSLSKNNQYQQQQPIPQQQFQITANNKLIPSSSPNSLSTKQSINKSLEVDYKFDKAIMNQFHRSTSLPNNNNFNQQQQSKSTPKPAHSNNPSNSIITNPQLYLNAQQQQQLIQSQLIQSQLMQRLVNQPYFSEAILKYQQSTGINTIAGQDKKSTDLNTSTNSLNNYNLAKKFNTGNNQQLTNQSQYLGTPTTVSSSTASIQPKIDDNLVSNNSNQINNTGYTQIQKQNDFDINNIFNSNNNDKQNKLNNSNQYFNTNSLVSNRYSSPNQLSQPNNSQPIATDLTKQSVNYQTSSDLVNKQTNSIYPNYTDYMNLNNQMQQQQQQLYQLNIQQQRQDDPSKRK